MPAKPVLNQFAARPLDETVNQNRTTYDMIGVGKKIGRSSGTHPNSYCLILVP
jgi:hypothetical protein